jgi:hypothetical protein
MQTIFRIVLTTSRAKEPSWNTLGGVGSIIDSRRTAPEEWEVSVKGDGLVFEKAANAHPDVAAVVRL